MNPLTEVWSQFQGVFPATLKTIADAVSFLGDGKWAAAIVLLTIAVRTLLLPLAVKQTRSMAAMARLQPEIKRLQQKFRNDRQKLNTAMMELYQREGVNPLGSCLPLFAQFPILYAMFFAIRDVPKTYDVDSMPFIFESWNLVDNASTHAGGWILLAIMTGTQLLSSRQMAKTSPQQNKMMQFLPLFFVIIMINFPAGLVLYWTTQNVYQVIQQRIMLRGQVPVPAQAAKGKGGGKGGNGKAAGKLSNGKPDGGKAGGGKAGGGKAGGPKPHVARPPKGGRKPKRKR